MTNVECERFVGLEQRADGGVRDVRCGVGERAEGGGIEVRFGGGDGKRDLRGGLKYSSRLGIVVSELSMALIRIVGMFFSVDVRNCLVI